MERVTLSVPVPTAGDVRNAYYETNRAIRKAMREAGRSMHKVEKKADRAFYQCRSSINHAGYAFVRPYYTTRRKAFGMETLNPFKLLGNYLRLKGIISEGYDYDRDAYVRRVNVGNMSLDYVLHRFHGGHWRVPSNPVQRIPPRYKLVKPGMRPLYFADVRDLKERMKDVVHQPGFSTHLLSPFILHDQLRNTYSYILPGRITTRLGLEKQCPFPG